MYIHTYTYISVSVCMCVCVWCVCVCVRACVRFLSSMHKQSIADSVCNEQGATPGNSGISVVSS